MTKTPMDMTEKEREAFQKTMNERVSAILTEFGCTGIYLLMVYDLPPGQGCDIFGTGDGTSSEPLPRILRAQADSMEAAKFVEMVMNMPTPEDKIN